MECRWAPEIQTNYLAPSPSFAPPLSEKSEGLRAPGTHKLSQMYPDKLSQWNIYWNACELPKSKHNHWHSDVFPAMWNATWYFTLGIPLGITQLIDSAIYCLLPFQFFDQGLHVIKQRLEKVHPVGYIFSAMRRAVQQTVSLHHRETVKKLLKISFDRFNLVHFTSDA